MPIQFPSQPDLKAELEILRETLRIASSLRKQLEDSPVHYPPPSDLAAAIPPFALPFPHEILAQLSTLQIPERVRESILHTFRSRILQMQQEYSASYRRTCLESARVASVFPHDFGAILRVCQASFERYYLPTVRAQVAFVLDEVAKRQKNPGSESKRPFNTEYIPVLEKYFEYNAYPSARDQSILAEKMTMTRRQIEVWFQNHRNRAKKDDKVLRRNTTDLPLRVALTVLQEYNFSQTERFPTPSDADSIGEDMDEDEDASQATSCIDAFDTFRPQHAFPTSYPPPGPDPFPSDNGVIKFSSPVWMRTPASSAAAPSKSPSIDMDDFAKAFHMKLNIIEGTKKRAASRTSKSHPAWSASTVTIPSRAPHPAFIRSHSHPSSTMLPTLLSPFDFRFPAGSRSTSTANAFLSPPLQQAAKSRKIAPLPRRIPVSFRATPPLPKQSITRTASFGSEYSSRSRSSSASSRNRTPEPTTPPQLPTRDIPAVQGSCVLQRPDEFDFSTLFGDDSDIFTATSSGNLCMLENISLTPDKQPRLSMPPPDFNSLATFTAPGYIPAQS